MRRLLSLGESRKIPVPCQNPGVARQAIGGTRIRKAIPPDFPLTVFYDGACPLCSREIGHYLRLDGRRRLRAVDISAPDFDPGPLAIPLRNFLFELHAIDHSGRVFRGVDAFRAIWLAFPASRLYRVMASVIALPGIGRLARFGYRLFARLRPSLPVAR